MRKLGGLVLAVLSVLSLGGVADAHGRHHRDDRDAEVRPANPGYHYGAVAYSLTTGRYGASAGLDDVNAAQLAAMATCGVADCMVVTWEGNGCVAFATAIDGTGQWGASGVKDNLGDAQWEAVKTCDGSGQVCAAATYACN
jgi:hypothetical protein